MKSSESFFSPTCYEPGKTEDVKNCHTGCGQDVDRAIIKGAAGVGQSQWEDAVCPQHYQVNGDVGLYGTTCQVCGPCDATEQPYKIIINHRRNAKGAVFTNWITKAVKAAKPTQSNGCYHYHPPYNVHHHCKNKKRKRVKDWFNSKTGKIMKKWDKNEMQKLI